ncbi:hypothetical protein [Burkholderia cepacia]|uniref:hypothetical protein n=2 Tax=Burkholderia cepacia TaxID=292 RepID=UPI0015893D10|nr:hypothetical protein [Burkholderia cepacia]MCA8348691.1 hypothetical protein [Burkholderia cepacia]MDN7894593.1 hypothetical protein [Burkholderia cepacia]
MTTSSDDTPQRVADASIRRDIARLRACADDLSRTVAHMTSTIRDDSVAPIAHAAHFWGREVDEWLRAMDTWLASVPAAAEPRMHEGKSHE